MSTDSPSTSPSASHAAARGVSAIALNQIPQVAGSVLYVAFVPRLLRTTIYGELAFAFALIVLFQMLGELGYQEIFSRFLPEVRQREGEAGVRAMARGLFGVKALVGLGLGLAAGLTAHLIAGWLSPEQSWLIGFSVAARVWTMAPFPLLLGLGETGKWSVETTWRQIVVTILTLVIVRTPSLTLALLAMALHELVFLMLGLWWVRGWLSGPKSEVGSQEAGGRRQKSEVGSQNAMPMTSGSGPWTLDFGLRTWGLLRFGFVFSLANYALVVMFRISPIAVEKLTGSHPEVGFFDLALGGLLLVYTFLGQVAYAFVPILTQLRLENQMAGEEAWLGRFVRYATLIVGLASGGMWAVAGPAAPLLFGQGFEPAANTLRAIAVGLLPLPLAWAAVILSAVEKRPAHKVRAALMGLGVFLVMAVALRSYASAGIALAFGLALVGYAVGFGDSARYALRAGGVGWAVALGATALFTPFLFISFPTLFTALVAWAGVAAAYALVIFSLRVVRLDELRQLALRLRR